MAKLRQTVNHLRETTVSIAHDFKEFLTRSNAVDLASALVMGAAVTAIINSLVNDMVMPCVSAVFGTNIRTLVIEIGQAQIAYGAFIQATLNFLLIAWVVFLFIRAVSKMRKKLDDIDPQSNK